MKNNMSPLSPLAYKLLLENGTKQMQSSILLTEAAKGGIIVITDETGKWYNAGVNGQSFGTLQNPETFEELWPDRVREAMEYCMRAAASRLPVVYISSGEDAFLLTTSPVAVVKKWLSSLPDEE